MTLLALKYWRELAIGALVLTLMAKCVSRDHGIEARGVAKERGRQADSVLVVTKAPLARVDTLLVHDTLTVRNVIARQVALRDTVLAHITDTVVVKEFVRVADSVRTACTELAGDCAAFRRLAQQRFDAYEAKLAAQPIAEKRSCTGSTVISGVIGVAVGFLAHR